MILQKSVIEEILWRAAKEYSLEQNLKTGFRKPIAGFATAEPQPYLPLRQAGMPEHFLPRDMMKECKTVIAVFYPYDKETVLSNRGGESASQRWADAYEEMGKRVAAANRALLSWMEANQIPAMLPTPAASQFDAQQLVGKWSHRHIARIAGLGSFGKNNMLITQQGCCGCFTSLLAGAEAESIPPQTEEFCLYYRDGSCKACLAACPKKALGENSFDRAACYEECLQNLKLTGSDVCGKCLAGMPCSIHKP